MEILMIFHSQGKGGTLSATGGRINQQQGKFNGELSS
jgi:hypothetical protein